MCAFASYSCILTAVLLCCSAALPQPALLCCYAALLLYCFAARGRGWGGEAACPVTLSQRVRQLGQFGAAAGGRFFGVRVSGNQAGFQLRHAVVPGGSKVGSSVEQKDGSNVGSEVAATLAPQRESDSEAAAGAPWWGKGGHVSLHKVHAVQAHLNIRGNPEE